MLCSLETGTPESGDWTLRRRRDGRTPSWAGPLGECVGCGLIRKMHSKSDALCVHMVVVISLRGGMQRQKQL